MTERASRSIALLALLAALCAPALATALPPAPPITLDAALPLLPASPTTTPITSPSSIVYRVTMAEGETLHLSLSPDAASQNTLDVDLFLYGPSATATDHAAPLARALNGGITMHPETIAHTARAAGTYYVEIYAAEGNGSSVLTWSIAPEPLLPVYRFYNTRTGTHFYTPSESEKATVQSTMAGTYRLEGVAYSTKATKNTQELYRFYNRANGSHFYTASVTERDNVYSNLSGTYSYDGPTYKVSPESAEGKATVWRFFNTRAGSHFYTADQTERDQVITTLGYMYTFEGEVFWLGQ